MHERFSIRRNAADLAAGFAAAAAAQNATAAAA
jgi:hypothetical protein